jgi:regulator of nucleoside diphosphate kinase
MYYFRRASEPAVEKVMSAIFDCQLTTKDCVVLEVTLERSQDCHDPILPMVQQKLAKAKVVFCDEIDPCVVTLNSRVAFRVNDGPPKTRIVAQRDEGLLPGVILPIKSLRGIALLGMREGQSIAVRYPCGLTETILVEHIEYQPEAARRLARTSASSGHEGCHIVSLSEHRQMRNASVLLPDDDDPGPTAA